MKKVPCLFIYLFISCYFKPVLIIAWKKLTWRQSAYFGCEVPLSGIRIHVLLSVRSEICWPAAGTAYVQLSRT